MDAHIPTFPDCSTAEDCPSEEHYVNCHRFPGLTIPLVMTQDAGNADSPSQIPQPPEPRDS